MPNKVYNLVKDLGFIKTGIEKFSGKKKYFSTGSIKNFENTPEGEFNYQSRPSRANRCVLINDVLQSRMIETNKAILINKDLNNTLFSTGFFQFRPPKEIILPKLLYYFLSSNIFYNIKNELCTGSTQKAINDEKLKLINISLPKINEQSDILKRIELSEKLIDRKIFLSKKKIQELDIFFNSLLNQTFNLDNENWKKVLLKDLCQNYKDDIVDGPFGSNLKSEHFLESGINVLKIQNIKKFNINEKNLSYVSKEKYKELIRHSFKLGDIIMTKLGAPLGICAINRKIDHGLIVADLVRIRVKKINTDFLCFQLNSNNINKYINSMQKGATRPRVKLSIVRNLPINVTDEKEQLNIVKNLNLSFEKISLLKQIYQKKIYQLEQLRFSTINNYSNIKIKN